MYLLDTNVVSELRRPKPHGGVLEWLAAVPDSDLHISAVTIGGLQAGIELPRKDDPSLCAKRPSALVLIMSISEQVVTSSGLREPTSR